MMRKIIYLSLSLLMTTGVMAGELKLELHGKGLAGHPVRVAVYSGNVGEKFMSAEPFYKEEVSGVSSDKLIVTVADLPPGKYAVATYAD
ncbi:MAG: hypothetical protein R8K20_04800, partial [Gallionellaceae bacterium]